MPSFRARSVTAWPFQRRQREQGATWAAVSRALELAGAAAAQFGLSKADRARIVRTHLAAARFLYQRAAERHVAGASTCVGRAWRQRQVRRSIYVRAFAEAESYLFQLDYRHEGPFHVPSFAAAGSWLPRSSNGQGRHRAAVAAI